MALRQVLVILVAATVGLTLQSTAREFLEKDRPCPDEMMIKPCICHTNTVFLMTLDCSLVNTNAALDKVFSHEFPIKHFQKLIIDHDPNDNNNQLTRIKEGTFTDLTFERVLIRGTKLEYIQDGVFRNSHDTLVQLDLQNNELKDFPFEPLALYTKLTILLLDGNKLPKLAKFESKSLHTLSIGRNMGLYFEPNVLENLQGLVNLNMESIGLTSIPKHMFQNLTNIYTINFNNNYLTELEEYTLDPIVRSVGRLFLANNQISTALPKALGGLLPDAIVDLKHNFITELTQSLWQPFLDEIHQGMVDLISNDLTCGCDMSWIFLNTSTIDSSARYLPIISNHTTCYDGSLVHFLDANVFEYHCQEASPR